MVLPGVKCLRTPEERPAFQPLTLVEGQLPEDLDGRLYRVGSGRFEAGGAPLSHWFDGEGLVLAIDFKDGAASAAWRLVEDRSPKDYPKLGRFGTAPRGVLRRVQSMWDAGTFVNAANTALVLWGNRLFALFEGTMPTEIDPHTLARVGVTDLGVVARAFSAHPKFHRPTGAWINQGFRILPTPHLDYYRLSPEGHASRISSTAYNGSIFTHDFAVTDHYIVSICPPVFASPYDFLVKGQSLQDAARWLSEKPTQFIVTPLDQPTEHITIDAPSFLYSHTASACDDGEDIIIHGIAADDGSNMDWIAAVSPNATHLPPACPSRLTSFRLNIRKRTVTIDRLSDACIDFPTVNPDVDGKPQRFVYATGFREEDNAYRDLFNAIVKIDLGGTIEKMSFGDTVFVSEAIFVSRPHAATEDDGYLISVLYDAEADMSEVAVLTATRPMTLVARFSLGAVLPMSFHGLWVPRARLS